MADINCQNCGIYFAISDKVETIWRSSGKTFYCPNGHALCWPKQPETPEIEKLRTEIKSLNSKLTEAQAKIDLQKKKISDLELDLEIYKPATTKSLE